MLQYLLGRPIAVCMSLFVSLIISTYLYFQIPVSLLPEIDVPVITINVDYRNAGPAQVELHALKPIREAMLTLSGLKTTQSVAQNESGKITLRFEHGTQMNLAFIEANEKIDRLLQVLPKEINRPNIIKASTSDIPIARIQVVPAQKEDLITTSALVSNVIKRRIEQIQGVSLVDLNGLRERVIAINPHQDIIKSLGLSEVNLITAVNEANFELGALVVKDGNYEYFMKVASSMKSIEDIGSLLVRLPNNVGKIQLRQIATITSDLSDPDGFHLFQGKDGIVVTVHKQSQARLPELMPRLFEAVEQFSADYPQLSFSVTQDQSLLLILSIENLRQSLLWGGAFAFAVLFMFMRGWREPVIMGIVLPLSLVLCFSLFSLIGISLNIISLSGLALGLGMLVDNSIVVIDSIQLKRKEGLTLENSCVIGTQEVIIPLLSSALTNLIVFLPLIFLSGITGALFYDQAMAVSSILAVSMLCTFVVVPLLYRLLFNDRAYTPPKESRLFLILLKYYSNTFAMVWRHKKTSLAAMSALIPTALILLYLIPKSSFPEMERTETIISIDWNEPIDVSENRSRTIELLARNVKASTTSEVEIGHQQFLLNHENFSPQHLAIYLKYENIAERKVGDSEIRKYLELNFPLSSFEFTNAPNAFEQVFASQQPWLEARFRAPKSKQMLTLAKADSLLVDLAAYPGARAGKGFDKETVAQIKIDVEKLEQFDIAYATVIEKLRVTFGDFLIAELNDFGEMVPVLLKESKMDFLEALQRLGVTSPAGAHVPMRELIELQFREDYRFITSDESGAFQAVNFSSGDMNRILPSLQEIGSRHDVAVDMAGESLESQKNMIQLAMIMAISVLLMYFILIAEFESLKQPLLVMATLPLGLAGSLLFLGATGGTLNIMSGIGLVVVLGVLDNDAILKIDRINRLTRSMPLESAIHEAGVSRFKPIVMNTCTNILAVLPILFSSGLGADLQSPIAITTIGGLIVGTFTALYFIPLIYYFTKRKI
jgi:multidrug efflux pump subunit AcrB